MIDILKGRYWDKAWSLVSGCTPCSPGCDHCWALAMEKRFHKGVAGKVEVHPERLHIPLKRNKPAVYAIRNDIFHSGVPFMFQQHVYETMQETKRHVYLVLTKRPEIMAKRVPEIIINLYRSGLSLDNVEHGLTICNQQEADEKIPVFLKVPGKKFLNIEPCLGAIDLKIPACGWKDGRETGEWYAPEISAVILGGETGPGARPMHPDWVRSVRDQCQAAEVPFFFKGWGEWAQVLIDYYDTDKDGLGSLFLPGTKIKVKSFGIERLYNGWTTAKSFDDETRVVWMARVGKKAAGRILDGRT